MTEVSTTYLSATEEMIRSLLRRHAMRSTTQLANWTPRHRAVTLTAAWHLVELGEVSTVVSPSGCRWWSLADGVER